LRIPIEGKCPLAGTPPVTSLLLTQVLVTLPMSPPPSAAVVEAAVTDVSEDVSVRLLPLKEA